MLKLKGVSKYYTGKDSVQLALKDINLELNIGEFVAICGESGSGKSTLLNVLSGLDTYEEGEYYINKEESSFFQRKDWEDFRQKYISFIFQDYNLIDSYTVLQNVELTMLGSYQDKVLRRKKALEIIERVGLIKWKNHKGTELSGGQKQRVVIARALAKESPIIMADEPTGNLDSENGADIMKLLKDISKDKLVVVVTHNFAQIEPYITRKIRLFNGEIVEDTFIKKIEEDIIASSSAKPINKGFKNVSKIAFQNILSTPKRTSYFLVLFLIVNLLFITILSGFYANPTHFMYNGGISYTYNDRVIIKRADELELNAEDYKKINSFFNDGYMIKNDLILDKALENVETEEARLWGFQAYPLSSKMKFDLNIYEGRTPKANNEIMYIVPKNDSKLVKPLLNKKIKFKGLETEYTVVGLAENKQAKYLDANINGVYFLADEFDRIQNGSAFVNLNSTNVYISYNGGTFAYSFGNVEVIIDSKLKEGEIECSIDYVKIDYGKDEVASVDSLVILNDNLNLVYAKEMVKLITDLKKQYVKINQVDYDKIIDSVRKGTQVSMLMSKNDIKNFNGIKNKLEENDYRINYPYWTSEETGLEATMRKAIGVFVVGLTAIIVVFMLYIVTNRLIKSRNKDYIIMRSIGFNQSFINRSLFLEMIYQNIFAFILSIIFAFLLALIPIPFTVFSNVFSLNFPAFILVFLISSCSILFLAYKYCRMMFGNTISSELKEDNND